MNFSWKILFVSLLSISMTAPEIAAQPVHPHDHSIRIIAYLAAYNHYAPPGGNWGNLPTNAIDWNAFDLMDYFALNAKPDGSLSKIAPYKTFSPSRLNAIVHSAHNAGKPIIFTVGGWGNHKGFASAISNDNRSTFIDNLIRVMRQWHFDGIDVDMEPIKDSDVDNYNAFIVELYQRLQKEHVDMLSKPFLSAATDWQPSLFAKIQKYFNQINLMTYDMSGAWGRRWVSWFNSPVYDAGKTFRASTKKLPSVNQEVQKFLKAGVKPSKTAIGIDFYGYVWSGGSGTPTGGISEPDQGWRSPPHVKDNVPYYKIMKQYYKPSLYHWDPKTESAYLSINEEGSDNDKFISYDDEKTIRAKFKYARKKSLGGIFIWDLSGGFMKQRPSVKDPLLEAVKKNYQEEAFSKRDHDQQNRNSNK